MKLTGKVERSKPWDIFICCWRCKSTFRGDDPLYILADVRKCPYCGAELILPTARPENPRAVFITRQELPGIWEDSTDSEEEEVSPAPFSRDDQLTPLDQEMLSYLLEEEAKLIQEYQDYIAHLQRQVRRMPTTEGAGGESS